MKRLLSAILTLALVLSLIPAVFANGESASEPKLYSFNYSDIGRSEAILLSEIDGEATDDEGNNIYEKYGWKYFDMSDALFEKQDIENIASVRGPKLGTSFNIATAEAGVDLSFAFSLKTPSQCGFYIPKIAWYTGSGSQTLKWYMSERVTGKEKVEDYIGDHNQIMIKTGLSAGTYEDKSSYESKQYPSLYSDVALYLQPNKEIISAFASAKKNYRFRSITLIPVLDADLKVVVDKNVLDLTDNKETSVSVTVSGTGVDDIPVSENFVEYKSSDENVAKVSANGDIVAVGGGKTKIYAQSPDGIVKSNEIEITVTAPSTEDEALTNAFEVKKEELKEYVAPSVVSVSAGGSVITPEKNSDGSYNIEAAKENKDGAKFLYWAKGLKANKKIVSFSNKLESYVPEEDGADWLIAVYDDMLPEENEYYNANGQLLATGEEPTLPSMAGYGEANAWKQYGETNIYVAEYAGKTKPDNVEVTVNGEKKTAPYGTEITCSATEENFKCWTKSNINGNTEIVSAEKVYKFKVWENCEVNAVNEDHIYTGDKFKIVIDSFTAGNETGIMAEFIGFGSNVVEKGIMWGSNKIAMTKTGTQFSVIADKNGEYKGYAIVGNQADGYTLITDGSVTVSDAE